MINGTIMGVVFLVLLIQSVLLVSINGFQEKTRLRNDNKAVADRPLNIAHRGASGIYPEHTYPAYLAAAEHGADYIECDLCVTKDLQLVCLHESWLSIVTNVADIYPPERMNTYFVFEQLRNITDYFSVDFTLAELRNISHRQRFDYRDQSFNDQLGIVTLHELIDMVQAENRTTGIYPEIKDPNFVNSLDILTEAGITFEELIVDVLESRGYYNQSDNCIILSFYVNSLLEISAMSSLPLMNAITTPVTNDILENFSNFLYGIAPNKNLIAPVGLDNKIISITDLVDRAHSFGLQVYPFTARNEYHHLAFDYEQDPYLEYEALELIGVDGIITDFPATYGRYLNSAYGKRN